MGLAGKITGMLLEIDNSELVHMLEPKNRSRAKSKKLWLCSKPTKLSQLSKFLQEKKRKKSSKSSSSRKLQALEKRKRRQNRKKKNRKTKQNLTTVLLQAIYYSNYHSSA